MQLEHHFSTTIEWTGNRGTGTSDYKSYGRDHIISAAGKQAIEGSSDRVFRGDADRWNPEEMLIAALSQCHMLSFLHVAASHGVVVVSYTDEATGTLEMRSNGGGAFTSVTLRPRVEIAAGDLAIAEALHQEASGKCFIAASVNFPVMHKPTTTVRGLSGVV
ncbi:MAG: OsmC family protein [Microbacteriaceae bacterium]